MRFAHVGHARREELLHQRVGGIAVLPRGPPVALLIRYDGIGVRRVNMPARGADQLARLLVNHLDPLASGVGTVPERLSSDGICDGSIAGRGGRGGALDREEELPEITDRVLVSVEFTADELVELGVRGQLRQFEGHLWYRRAGEAWTRGTETGTGTGTVWERWRASNQGVWLADDGWSVSSARQADLFID